MELLTRTPWFPRKTGLRGCFYFKNRKTGVEYKLPNFVTDEGAQQLLKMIAQGAAIGEDSNWYVGLMGLTATKALTLATIAGEPDSSGGYARQLLNQNSTDWPTANLLQVNGIYRIRSATVTFSASGADFSTSIWRMFLCNDAAGTTGTLFAISSPLPAAKLIADSEDYDTAYELALN